MGASAITASVKDYKELTPQKIILEMPFGTLMEAVEGRIKMMKLPPQPISTLITFWGGIQYGNWAFNMKPQEFAKKLPAPRYYSGELMTLEFLEKKKKLYLQIWVPLIKSL